MMAQQAEPHKLYKKITLAQLEKYNANEQNKHIALRYEECNDVLLALIKQGVTVESVSINGPQPIIKLLSKPRRTKLASSVVSIRGAGGGRRTELHSAFVGNCRIEWTQPTSHR